MNWLKNILQNIPQSRQRQDSLVEQLKDLSYIADRVGCYDAGTYLRSLVKETLSSEEPVPHQLRYWDKETQTYWTNPIKPPEWKTRFISELSTHLYDKKGVLMWDEVEN